MDKLFKPGGKLHFIKNLYRRYKYGAGCCDRYNLDYYLATKILRPLKEFKKDCPSSPVDFATSQEWDEALDKMIFAFEKKIEGDIYDIETDAKIQEGFELFGKYYQALWY